jgi:protein SDA1
VVDLPLLQSRVKRDPKGYKDEFLKKYQHYQTLYEILKLKPSDENEEFDALVKFISQVATCYPEELKEFPNQIVELLESNATIIAPELRITLVQALILLRNRNLLSPTSLLSLFFKLFRCKDKKLRTLLHNHIVGDIKRCNAKKRNDNLNKTLQNFMYTMLQDESSVAPRQSLSVMIELYKRRIWNNRKTVNVISLGVFSEDQKIVSKVLNFFLSQMKLGDLDDEEGDDDINVKLMKKKKDAMIKYAHIAQKKTKKRKRKLRVALQKITTERKRFNEEEQDETKQYNFEALNQINDPQGYGEKVFNSLKASKFGFEFRLRMMSLISRLISTHNLLIDGFYSYLQKYAQPHQQHITQILAILGQSCHSLVSPDIIEPVLMTIVNHFITDRRPSEVIAIGLNTVREICMRCPLVMNEGLLKDLVQYRKSKDKGVMMAARSVVTLFRLINPSLLPKKERGKFSDINTKPLEYGEEVNLTVPGMDLLNEQFDFSSDENLEEMGDFEGDLNDFEKVYDGDLNGEGNEIKGGETDEKSNKSGVKEEDSDEIEEVNEGDLNEFEEVDEGDINEEDINEVIEEESEDDGSRITKKNIDMSENNSETYDNSESSFNYKILSQEDLDKINDIQMKLLNKDHTRVPIKRKLEQLYDFEIDSETIQGYRKRRKKNKEERIEDLNELKEEWEITQKPQHKSKTNAEKKKTKPYSMLRHKALKKVSRSCNQKKRILSRHIERRRVRNTHRTWHG